MANWGTIRRRLDALERALGDGGGDDFGPDLVIVLTRYWRDVGEGEGGDVNRAGKLREQRLVDEAVAQVRAEALARREHVASIIVGVDHDGRVQIGGVPWLPPGDHELAEVSHVLGRGRQDG